MPKVYWLKRATPRMKYVHMNHVMQEKEQLAEQQAAEAKRKREREEIQAEVDAMQRCIEIEGQASFHRWWNSEEVPDFGPRRERIELIEKRILNLKHEGSVANENEDGEKSQ